MKHKSKTAGAAAVKAAIWFATRSRFFRVCVAVERLATLTGYHATAECEGIMHCAAWHSILAKTMASILRQALPRKKKGDGDAL